MSNDTDHVDVREVLNKFAADIEGFRNDLGFVKNRVSNHNASIDYLHRAINRKLEDNTLAQLTAAERMAARSFRYFLYGLAFGAAAITLVHQVLS